MIFISYALVLIFILASIFIGIILAKIAKEELNELSKSIDITKSIILVLFLAFSYLIWSSEIIGLDILLILITGIGIFKKMKKQDLSNIEYLIYAIFGAYLFYSSPVVIAFIICSILICIYAMIDTSKLVYENRDFRKKLITNYVYLIITALIFYFMGVWYSG